MSINRTRSNKIPSASSKSCTELAMAWIFITAVFSVVFVYLLQTLFRQKKLPPGPWGLPIIGHFHLLSKNPHQDLHRLARKHGPIMYMRFGSIPTVVVSSPAAAKLFLKTHDLNFATRPYSAAGHYLSNEQRGIVLGRYSPYWRDMRKLVTLELLSNRKVAQFQNMRETEVGLLVNSLRRNAEKRDIVDMSTRIMSSSGDLTCLMVFGRRYGDNDLDSRGFKDVLKETMEEAGALNLGDFFPKLEWLDLQGSVRRLKKLHVIFDGLMERIIDEHANNEVDKTKGKDFVDTMMSIMESGEAGFEFDRRHVKAILLDMMLAGMDTQSSAVEWTLSELIRHPTVMKKLQHELKEVVGMDQMVEESHLPKLEYLDCVIRESLRLHPPVTLLIHEAMEDNVVDGFHLPKETRVLINAWSIARDPMAWKDPEMFSPERFIGSDIDVRGHDFQLIPFGTGRRVCPGIQLGLTIVQLMVAQLVHCFDWELPEGMLPGDLDMNEHFGLVTARDVHLTAIPTYRLHN